MIKRVFFISGNAFGPGDILPPEENLYYSLLVDPLDEGALEKAYARVVENGPLPLALTLNIHALLSAGTRRTIASFLFIPSYLTIAFRPVILVAGGTIDLLREEAAALSACFSLQGIREPLFYRLTPAPVREPAAGAGELVAMAEDWSGRSPETLAADYGLLLRAGAPDSRAALCFLLRPGQAPRTVHSCLQKAEQAFAREAPRLYSLIQDNKALENELAAQRRKYAATEAELGHQKQYVATLRSNHAAKELQDYYNREYEILPLWYKRFGHVLKVLTGKRTFRSLFDDKVQKYKS